MIPARPSSGGSGPLHLCSTRLVGGVGEVGSPIIGTVKGVGCEARNDLMLTLFVFWNLPPLTLMTLCFLGLHSPLQLPCLWIFSGSQGSDLVFPSVYFLVNTCIASTVTSIGITHNSISSCYLIHVQCCQLSTEAFTQIFLLSPSSQPEFIFCSQSKAVPSPNFPAPELEMPTTQLL